MVKSICVLGFGQIGKEWVNVISGFDWVDKIYIVEPDNVVYKEISEGGKVVAHCSLNDIDPNQVDILIDASPPNSHLQNARWALKNKIDFLQEKPALTSLLEINKMKKLIQNRESKYSINHLYRYKKWVQYILGKNIQDINYIELKLILSVKGLGFRASMGQPALLDYLIHHLDLIEYITNSKIIMADFTNLNDKLSGGYKGNSAFVMEFKTSSGVAGSILCTIASALQQTNWDGDWCFYADNKLYEFRSSENKLVIENKKLVSFKDTSWLKQLQNSLTEFMKSKNSPMSIEENIDLLERIIKLSS